MLIKNIGHAHWVFVLEALSSNECKGGHVQMGSHLICFISYICENTHQVWYKNDFAIEI